ncbi:MAG: hypothetical protein RR767_09180, partial [Acinetobacter sp.]
LLIRWSRVRIADDPPNSKPCKSKIYKAFSILDHPEKLLSVVHFTVHRLNTPMVSTYPLYLFNQMIFHQSMLYKALSSLA